MTNREIRRQARKLFATNAKLLIPIWLGFGLLNMAISYAAGAIRDPWVSSSVSLLLSILFAPVTSMGLTFVSLRLWRGQACSYSDVFAFTKEWNLLARAMAVSALYVLITNSLTSFGNVLLMPNISSILIYLLLSIVYFWVVMRLFLTTYLFLGNPMQSTIKPFVGSFSMMKGRVGGLFRFMFSLIWIFLILLIAVFSIVFSVSSSMASLDQIPSGLSWMTILIMLCMALIGPYISLAGAGYADQLIRERLDANSVYEP